MILSSLFNQRLVQITVLVYSSKQTYHEESLFRELKASIHHKFKQSLDASQVHKTRLSANDRSKHACVALKRTFLATATAACGREISKAIDTPNHIRLSDLAIISS
jgi:hypothetical protein